jgi:hypothetical protein
LGFIGGYRKSKEEEEKMHDGWMGSELERKWRRKGKRRTK